MSQRSFVKRAQFHIYDAIIPLFRLVTVLILIGFTYYFNRNDGLSWQYSFVLLYLIYAIILLLFKPLREVIILKYPAVIGICESLIISYGVSATGGENSLIYFSYIFIITFFGMVHGMKISMFITGICALMYSTALLSIGSPLDANTLYKCLFLLAFAVFIGSINGRLSKYHMKLAMNDPLTNLFNRQYFYGTLDHMLDSKIEKPQPFALVVVDVNDFKHINDSLGHLEGDRILKAIGKLIQNQVRADDIAARYGGDEFVILLPNITDERAKSLSAHIQNSICDAFDGKVSVSVGYALYPDHGLNADDLFHSADMAMYEDKRLKPDLPIAHD